MRIKQVMTRQVETIPANAPAEAARNLMRTRRIRHLVVLRDNEAVGVISDRDFHGMGSLRQVETVGDLMTSPAVTAFPEMTLKQAANLLRGRSIGCLPVFEEERLAGILTTTDLLELIGRGIERPVSRGKRRILKGRGPRRKPFTAR